MFELHPQLKKDCFLIKELKLCQVLLINNNHYPWFVLVPKKPNLTEIFFFISVPSLFRSASSVVKYFVILPTTLELH